MTESTGEGWTSLIEPPGGVKTAGGFTINGPIWEGGGICIRIWIMPHARPGTPPADWTGPPPRITGLRFGIRVVWVVMLDPLAAPVAQAGTVGPNPFPKRVTTAPRLAGLDELFRVPSGFSASAWAETLGCARNRPGSANRRSIGMGPNVEPL